MRSWMWAWGCREPAEGSTEGAPETAIYTALPAQPDADGDGSPDLADCERDSDDGLVTIVGGGSYTDLALALQEAQPGDELLVCPGFYTGVFSADGVTLTGLQGRQVTTLSSSFYDTSVLQTTGDVRVQGLTLRFGQAEEGGGIRHQGPGQLTLVDSRVQENLAERGGGIAVIGGSLSLIDSDVWDNEATSGGGLYAVNAVLDLGTSTVSSNLASDSGGGVWMRDSELVGGRLESNLAVTSLYVYSYTGYPLSEARGGGLAASGTCTVSGVEIVQNSAREGAGVYTSGEDLDCRLTLQDTEIRDNGDELLSSGGGVWARYCALSLQGTTEIVSNRAGVGGGGVVLLLGSLVGGIIRENSCAWGHGGGIEARDASIVQVFVTGNTAPMGGGLATSGVIDLQHVELSDNAATSGAGLYVQGELQVSDSVLLRNVASSGGGGAYLEEGVLTSIESDWGEGADDNSPDDVSSGAGVLGYGSGASFTCDAAGCSPLP